MTPPETPGPVAFETDGPMHLWFELSYAAYLVVPRTVIQSMPHEWQGRMRDCLNEAAELYEYALRGDYSVQIRDEGGRFVHDPYRDYHRGRRRLAAKGATHD